MWEDRVSGDKQRLQQLALCFEKMEQRCVDAEREASKAQSGEAAEREMRLLAERMAEGNPGVKFLAMKFHEIS